MEEGPMANGLAQGLHQTHGRTATAGMRLETMGRQAWTDLLGTATTDDHLNTIIDHLHHHLQAAEDLHGATGRVRDTPIFHYPPVKVVIPFQMYLATPMDQIADEVDLGVETVAAVTTALPLAMSTFQVTTTAHDDHASPTTDNVGAPETLVIPETGTTATGQTGAMATGIEILATLAESEETDARDRVAQSGGIGIVTRATTTSIGGANHCVRGKMETR